MLKIRFAVMLALAGFLFGSVAFAQVPVAENAMVVPTAAFEAGIEALIRQHARDSCRTGRVSARCSRRLHS